MDQTGNLTRDGGAEFVGVEGDETPFEFVAADAGRSDEDDGPRNGRVGHETGDFLVSGDFLPIEILVLCQSVHNLLSSRAAT